MISRTAPTRVRSRLAIGGSVAAVALLALLAALFARSGLAGSAQLVVDDRVGATHLTANEVASIVMSRLGAMGTPAGTGQIIRMTVIPMAILGSVEPSAGSPPSGAPDAEDVVWVVRAQGHFVGLRVPPGAQPITASTGYVLVDDASGETIGMGMP